jgi:hypothetical protein
MTDSAAASPAMDLYARTTAPFEPRSHAGILRYFDGFDLVEPGLVSAPLWRPDAPAGDGAGTTQIAVYGGAGCKP